MTSASFLTGGLLVLVAVFFVGASSANTTPGEPLFPTSEERASFTLGLLAIACAFGGGALL